MIGQQTIVTVEQNVHFERLLTNDKDMQKAYLKEFRTAVMKARRNMVKDARSGLQMESDPRDAYKAIKSTLWKKKIGGSISLLAKRRAGKMMYVSDAAPARRTGRGGNRMPRGKRTEQLQSYYGSDRGFILRFLNQGTTQRTDNKRGGNRGSIRARNWFDGASHEQLMRAAEQIEKDMLETIENRNID